MLISSSLKPGFADTKNSGGNLTERSMRAT
jgi:hypothetical protein